MKSGAVIESHIGNVSVYAIAQKSAAVTYILHLNTPAIGFGNVDAVLSIDADRCGVLDLIFISEAIERKAFGNRDSLVEIGRDELGVERQKGEETKKKSAWHNFFGGFSTPDESGKFQPSPGKTAKKRRGVTR